MFLGDGKIGRTFIGQEFSRSRFEVVFVDINKQLIEKLNKESRYRVIIKSHEKDETIWIITSP